MQYTNLGRTGLKVSRLCLGTMNFGPETSEPDSHLIMDEAIKLGVNFFDTANTYGWKQGEGITEQIIGRWLAQDPARRDKIVLATKVWGPMGDGPNDGRLSAYHIRQACEDSLKRLQTDHIDLYQMHRFDPQTPWQEIWQAMEQLVRQGKVLYIGSSNFGGWDIADANHIAGQRNFMGLVCEQSPYNLGARMIELEVIPACKHYGLGLIPFSPHAGGMLGGVLKGITDGRRASERMQERVNSLRPQLERYEELCRQLGEPPAAVALAWTLANPVVTAPIIGPRTREQLVGALRALELKLDGQTMSSLEDIWPRML
jgi:aryl-alcohol dehydrogenase-like predicted oxidoreductase